MTLEQQIKDLENQIRPLQEELARLKAQLLEDSSPIKLGDVIEWRAGDQKRTGVVRAVGGIAPKWLCFRVQRIRANGTLGSGERVHHWQEPKLAKGVQFIAEDRQ